MSCKKNVPNELAIAASAATSRAHTAWTQARKAKDFSLFKEALAENIRLTKELIPYWKKEERTNYDVLLNQYEPNMTVEILDNVFSQVRDGIMDIRRQLEKRYSTRYNDLIS